MRFDQCGAVVQNCSSALLDAIQEKKTVLQNKRSRTLSRCAAFGLICKYAARFSLNNKINTTKTDSGENAAVKNTSDYNDVEVCTSSAVRYSSKVRSHHAYLYSTLYNR